MQKCGKLLKNKNIKITKIIKIKSTKIFKKHAKFFKRYNKFLKWEKLKKNLHFLYKEIPKK